MDSTAQGTHMPPAEMAEHVKTWNGFVSFIKWSLGFILLVMVFLAIFRTH